MYLKVPACILFPNKSACIYDNIHASKQIPWIHVDEFQNEKDIQLSLVNIMPLISIPGGLVTLFIKRSLDQFAGVGSSLGHKNDMFCLSGVVFFSRKVSFVVRPNIRMNSNAFNNLEGQYSPPPALYESISSYARSHLPLIQEEQVVSYWRKNMHL